jgi:hypothetical protein
MKKCDLVVVMLHWMLVVTLLGTAATGILIWDKALQPSAAFVFPPENVGVIHIGLSVAVAAFFFIHLSYLKHKNYLSSIALRLRMRHKGQCFWRRVNIMFYWVLLFTVILETVSGILLTKLINQDVLARIFMIERGPLLTFHLYLVLPIFVFPFAHVLAHWLDGRFGRILSMFRPHVFPRKPSLLDIIMKLKLRNALLLERVKDASIDPQHVSRR